MKKTLLLFKGSTQRLYKRQGRL